MILNYYKFHLFLCLYCFSLFFCIGSLMFGLAKGRILISYLLIPLGITLFNLLLIIFHLQMLTYVIMNQFNIDYIKRISTKITTFFPFVSPFVADFIACQSALETAYGRSVIFLENHNAFGMKFPTKRLTTAVSESRNHANYYNVDDSIIDYFLWCSYNCMIKLDFLDLTEFISHFKFSSYCPIPTYVEKIDLIYQSFKKSSYEQN